MQQEIDVVMSGGIEMEELAIQCVREPGQWMPVSVVKGSEGPFHGIPGQSVLDLGILQNVNGVIESDELVMERDCRTPA